MKKLHVNRREVDFEYFKNHRPSQDHCNTFIDEPTAVYEDGKLMIVYDVPDFGESLERLRWAVTSIPYQTDSRSGGLLSTSRIFGYSPRHTTRNDFCSVTRLAREKPEQHAALCSFAGDITRVYAGWHPDFYQKHRAVTQENVLEEYHLMGGVFTSGIVNKTTALGYHFDAGNFKDVWSNMVVLKEHVQGGYLAVPEYDMLFALRDGAVLLFDGQGLMHGVTPIKLTRTNGYRYSVVYYSLRQMWNCLAIDDELIRIRKLATERARKRLKEQRSDLKR